MNNATPKTSSGLSILIAGSVCLWLPQSLLVGTNLDYPGTTDAMASPYAWMFLSASLVVLATILAPTKSSQGGRILTLAAALLYSAGTLAMTLLPNFAPRSSHYLSFVMGSSAVAGVGFGPLMMAWGRFYLQFPATVMNRAMIGTALCQACGAALFQFAPDISIGGCAMPLISAALLHRGTKMNFLVLPTCKDPNQSRTTLRASFIFGVASMSLGYGVLVYLTHTNLVSPPAWIEIGVLAVIVIGLAFLLLSRRFSDYATAWQLVAFTLITGFVIYLAGGSHAILIAYAVTSVGYGMYEYVLWVASIDMARSFSSEPVKFISWTFVFTIGMQGLGYMGSAYLSSVLPPSQSAPTLAAVVLIVSVVTILWLLPADLVQRLFDRNTAKGRPEPEAGNASGNDSPAVAPTSTLKNAFNLTNRETEVATLLAAGRSAKFIQEKLCISEGTAWTHIRHIYQKMGVSTRQEFLSKAEETEDGPR